MITSAQKVKHQELRLSFSSNYLYIHPLDPLPSPLGSKIKTRILDLVSPFVFEDDRCLAGILDLSFFGRWSLTGPRELHSVAESNSPFRLPRTGEPCCQMQTYNKGAPSKAGAKLGQCPPASGLQGRIPSHPVRTSELPARIG